MKSSEHLISSTRKFHQVAGKIPRTRTEISPTDCGPGNVFGIPYQGGGLIDLISELFAGPHDYANILPWYDAATGNIRNFSGWSRFQISTLDLATNYTTSLAFAAPFALSAMIEQTYSFGALSVRPRRRP